MTDTVRLTPEAAIQEALIELLARLDRAGYAFVSPTPSTHGHVASRRRQARAGDLRDIFGWGLPFKASDLGADLLTALKAAGEIKMNGDLLRSAVRVSTLDGRLHIHSARSSDPNSVFLGPDSYRFVRFLDDVLKTGPAFHSALDVGAGAGAGALALAARAPRAKITASDVNPLALTYLKANAAHSNLRLETAKASGLEIGGAFDLIVANPPYVADREERTYRHGGGGLGTELAIGWVDAGLKHLTAGGRFILYSGSPIVKGGDVLRDELQRVAAAANATLDYEEIDPDVFGGMLRGDAYQDVERIAAVGAVLTR